jgi:hypothetical protein
MPGKRVILLEKATDGDRSYRVIHRFDVPAAYQPLFRGRVTAFDGATPAERAEVDSGAVMERVEISSFDPALTPTQIQTELENAWTALNNGVQALRFDDITDPFLRYGRHWTGSTWTPGAGAPPAAQRASRRDDFPAFTVLTGISAFSANKFHLVLSLASTAPAGLAIRISVIVLMPTVGVVTGVISGDWTLRRRTGGVTPAGGTVVVVPMDPADALPVALTAHNTPTTAPSGGTVEAIDVFVPQADEAKLTTLDAPTMAALQPFGGQILYDASRLPRSRALTIRPGQTVELQQDATGGTGNCRVQLFGTVE